MFPKLLIFILTRQHYDEHYESQIKSLLMYLPKLLINFNATALIVHRTIFKFAKVHNFVTFLRQFAPFS